MTYNASVFNSIKNSLIQSENPSESGNTLYKEILKFKPGHTYILRLLPNITDFSKTFYHYYQHGWNSFSTGKFISTLSLQTIGKPDPISRERYRMINSGNAADKAKAETVKWQEQWLVNVYVVEDPTTPENNGTIKLFRHGKKLNRLIRSAIDGEDSSEFGARVFDLSPEGVNLKLKVEKQGDFITYDSSRFTNPISLNLSPERQEEIYKSVIDLAQVFPLRSEEEIVELWKTHFLNEGGLSVGTQLNKDTEEIPSKDTSVDESASMMSEDQIQNLINNLSIVK